MSHDSQSQQAVLAELEWASSVNPAHIGVAANAGVGTLTGHVANYMQKHAAETTVDRLGWDASIPHDADQIRVEHGWVTLTGEVDW